MKKLISLVLALVMAFSLCGCGSKDAELEARIAELEAENAELKQAAATATPTLSPKPTVAPTQTAEQGSHAEILGEYIFDFMNYMNKLKSIDSKTYDVAVPLKDEFTSLGGGEWHYSGETDFFACAFYALTETEDIDSKLLRVGVTFWIDQFKDSTKTSTIAAIMIGMITCFDKLASSNDAAELLTDLFNGSAVTMNGIKWEIKSFPLMVEFQGELVDQDSNATQTNQTASANTQVSANSNITMGEQNALYAADMYLNVIPFSYTGLIKQLKHDGYSDSEAKYGADNCGADWKEQAARAAQQYLDLASFSRSGLINQLIHDGYTQEEAEYGVTQAGY